jgi:hypothetical protein
MASGSGEAGGEGPMAVGRSAAAAIFVSMLTISRAGRAVVDRVTFAARFGAVTGLLGPNGAGKSSIVKALAGVLPYEGDVTLDDKRACELDGPTRARHVAYVPQQSELRAALSMAAVVEQGRYAGRRRRRRDRRRADGRSGAAHGGGRAGRPDRRARPAPDHRVDHEGERPSDRALDTGQARISRPIAGQTEAWFPS